ncbi:MAG: hypothetical protein JGK30_28290 [Microcoleus sp. PH2017_40_RAT_O_B]|uniref:hypothetical protein n=1 Tax=unclassified Microcoleus TaxID=2642155 RepID=UPI001DD45673|nr:MULTISPECIES: hypothetical protein [unclassified Microcoleus]MCC3437519.1 hypothetical protein [Microcoleus sp. PH2017_05_CCC_O_A]MCC3613265.1 hypothetical protein [Microcoleus sp. PH2017_40_RAT_O_B]
MATPITFQPQTITIDASAPTTTAVPRQGLNLGPTTGGKLSAPIRPPAAYTPQVQVVKNVPANLKSAAPVVTQKAAVGIGIKGLGVGLGVAGAVAQDLIFPEPAGFGSDMVGGRPIQQVRSQISDPRDSGAFRPATAQSPQRQPQRQVQSPVGRPDPFAPIFEFEPIAQPQQAPTQPASRPQIKTPQVAEKPRPALDINLNPGTGTITLAPVSPKGKPLNSPSLLDEVTQGGVNLLTPIVDFLKKLDLDIQQLKQGFQLDFSPLLQGISDLINPLFEMIAAIPQTFDAEIVRPIMEGIVELLTPIASLTATGVEIAATNPRTTSETVAEMVAPIAVGIALIGVALDGLGKAISGLSLKTVTQVPQGMGVAAQIPLGMNLAAQIPVGMATAAQIPIGMASAAQIPVGMAIVAELPQTITATADLTEVDVALATLQKTLQKTQEDLDKCCRDISDKLKRKKREDDDRFPEFKNNGFIECDGATIPYDYAGEGLKGLNKQLDVILGMNKMLIKKVCDIDVPAFTFPDIFGSGTYVCDETFGTYNYSGVGLLGIQSQIDRVLDFNKKILNQVCDIEIEFPLIQGGGTYVCDETFGTYNYSGVGLLGLQSQIDRVLDFNKKILDEVCDIDVPAFTFPDIFGGGTYACGSDVFDNSYSGAGFLGLSSQIDKLTAISTKILGEVCEPDTRISGDINFLDCEGGTQILLYNGDGIAGLSSQISAFTELQKLSYAKACEPPTCYPVQPGDEFAEFDVPRQLVLTWGQNYPKQTGSLWHTQIPNPREDLEWCRDFDNLIYTKGNVYGRLLWGSSKIKSGVRAETEEEAERILDLIDGLSVSEGKLRITKGGAVKLNPAVRSVRCVRAAIAQLGTNGVAETVKCFVPPIEGC